MNWLERYVEGVKRYLPRKNREDVSDEIMSLLSDKLDAKEITLGKKMSDEQMKTWIESQPHPMIMAAQYQNYPEIVAREFYPPYFLTLKVVFGIIFGVLVFSMGIGVLLGRVEVADAFLRLLGGMWENLIWAFGSVTLVFHFIGRKTSAQDLLKKWKAKDLPTASGKWVKVPIGEKAFEIVVYVIMLVLLNDLVSWDWIGNVQNLASFNPEAKTLIPWLNALLFFDIAQNLWLIFKPQWNRINLSTNLLLSGLGLGILGLAMSIDPFVTVNLELAPEDLDERIVNWADQSMNFVLYIIGAIILFEVARDIYRIIKLKK